MNWERIENASVPYGKGIFSGTHTVVMSRAKVPGGWLVLAIMVERPELTTSITFYPDPSHSWNPETQDGE